MAFNHRSSSLDPGSSLLLLTFFFLIPGLWTVVRDALGGLKQYIYRLVINCLLLFFFFLDNFRPTYFLKFYKKFNLQKKIKKKKK